MAKHGKVTSSAVMSAIYHLKGVGDRGRKTWPTVGRLASYLKADERDVQGILLGLRRQRLFTDRQRGGQRVWMPWDEA